MKKLERTEREFQKLEHNIQLFQVLKLFWVHRKHEKPTPYFSYVFGTTFISQHTLIPEIIIYLWLRFEGSSTRNGHCRARSKHLDGKNKDRGKPTRWSVKERPGRGIWEERLPAKQQIDGDAKRWLGKQMRYLTKDKYHLEFQGKASKHLWCTVVCWYVWTTDWKL